MEENMNEVWTIAEARQGVLHAVSYELLARGRDLADKLGVPLASVVLGEVPDEGLQALFARGADKVYHVADARLNTFVTEIFSNALCDLVRDHKPQIILAAATFAGRTLLPHIAVRLDAGLTADCTQLEIESETGLLLQTRPAIGGNIMATIKTPLHRPQMATVRPKSTRVLDADGSRSGEVVNLPFNEAWLDGRIEVLETRREGGASIEEADVVVAGGRGMKRKDNFEQLFTTARLLNGAVGCSRECVDRGWMPYAGQIGLSGKTISPRLYIAAAISGSIQHLAGIKTSENIIAINKDPEAPIFSVADLGIVGDVFELLPELNRRLERLNQEKAL
jgi:electron transfer flavoprotein alpha subunit